MVSVICGCLLTANSGWTNELDSQASIIIMKADRCWQICASEFASASAETVQLGRAALHSPFAFRF